jgi:hypothetical protein
MCHRHVFVCEERDHSHSQGVCVCSLCGSFVSAHLHSSQAPPTSPASRPMALSSGVDLIGWRSKPGQGSVARLPSDNWRGVGTWQPLAAWVAALSVIHCLSCNLIHLQTIAWTSERLSAPCCCNENIFKY